MTVKIADILTPDVWNDYGVQRTAELSALVQSGIIAAVPGIEVPNGGGSINIPHFNDLTGDAENLSDTASLTPDGITTGKQVATIIGRGKAWGVNDLAGVFSGADPARAIMDRIAAYWAREQQKELISILTGVFGAATMSGLVHDITAGADAASRTFTGENFIDATQKLGDAKGSLTAVAMHSATEAFLAKQDLIVYERESAANARIPFYMGKRVIVDDGLPVSSGNYTTFLFGAGVFGYNERPIGEENLETDRDILAGETVMAMRRRFVLHPVGTKWVGTPAGDFASRAELATGTNWQRVFDVKNIPIVAFKHKNA